MFFSSELNKLCLSVLLFIINYLSQWEASICNNAIQAQRWQRFLRNSKSLDRLYLVVALTILFSTSQGMAVQIKGLRTQVDSHHSRGISYLKIGLRWLTGVIHKGRNLFPPIPLFSKDPEPCFASKKAKEDYYDAIWFSRIKEIKYCI